MPALGCRRYKPAPVPVRTALPGSSSTVLIKMASGGPSGLKTVNRAKKELKMCKIVHELLWSHWGVLLTVAGVLASPGSFTPMR